MLFIYVIHHFFALRYIFCCCFCIRHFLHDTDFQYFLRFNIFGTSSISSTMLSMAIYALFDFTIMSIRTQSIRVVFTATTANFRPRTFKFRMTKLLTFVTSLWFRNKCMNLKPSSKGLNEWWQVHSLFKRNKGCLAGFRISNPFNLNCSNGLGQLFQIFILLLDPMNYTFYFKFNCLIVAYILV